MSGSPRLRGALMALGAAFFFGLHSPVLKPRLAGLDPWLAAGLMHLGSGIGLSAIFAVRRIFTGPLPPQRRLHKPDLPWLAGTLVFAGMIGPVLWMYGLHRVAASTSSLLLNLEGVFTVLLAWFIFGEARSHRVAVGIALVVTGGVVLAWSGVPDTSAKWGMAAIVASSLCWAMDTNLTGRISQRDPVLVAGIKGLVAGTANTAVSLALGSGWPGAGQVWPVLLIGFFGFGVSLLFFILALRSIGAASTITFFSISPFIGSLVAVLWLGEPVTRALVIAGALMALGIAAQVERRGADE